MIWILIFIFLILIFILYKKFSTHYWYNNLKTWDKDKFYHSDKFNNGSTISSNLENLNINEIIELYKYYYPSFRVSDKTLKNFFNDMEKPAIIYKKENKIIACVLNSINNVYYKNIINVNFVDYAIVDKNIRNKNIFRGLMNEIAIYCNNNNTHLVIFKIDLKPIESLPNYNFKSEYYSCIKRDMKIGDCKIEKKNITNEYYPKINNFFKKYKFYPIITSNLCKILINNEQRITLICDEKIVFNLKYNSEDNLELLYVIELEEDDESFRNGIAYIFNNIKFKMIFVDGIGNNLKVIKLFGDYFKCRHDTYHYTVGSKDKLKSDEIYYYF